MKKLYQPFHLVTESPWPILLSFNIMFMLVTLVFWFYNFNFMFSLIALFLMLLNMYQWWRDIIRESLNQGFHINIVLNGIKMGMILFIVSEVLFFFSFFWCYFHMFLSPSIEIGTLWPPMMVISFNPFFIPLLNTLILLSSGITITLSHYYLINNNLDKSIMMMIFTISLGLIFTMFQMLEYNEAMFTISDSVYGSIFFMGTGFHGLHVLIGTVFLMINLYRMLMINYSLNHHFGFEAAAWYWHFVDVVWLFLYLLIYYWSN
uniref:Cytochrome c oxidase subunit 3 n=1 Tax=Gonatocerus sp. ZCS-2018 TaxID=2305128 RepID=A0A346PZ41_9HYME|nr:cytochrome c oxidase subunit 3 [Gonatocerus sp. ZCS-2018]